MVGMMTSNGVRYDVEGMLLERPFRIRRLGHFGVDLRDMEAGLRFYVRDLGFRITDALDLGAIPPLAGLVEGVDDPRLYFTSHGSDHHALLMNHRTISERMGVTGGEVTINQLTWQVGSLREVVDGCDYLTSMGAEVVRIGRDMPGANWHVYFRDPDGHQNELYYGMEQIGWQRRSRPSAMYDRGFRERPALPQISEDDEVEAAIARGVDLQSGYRPTETGPATHDVGGVLLRRPFKITRIGPVSIFVDDVEASTRFYAGLLGLVQTEEVSLNGSPCRFLRAGGEHHVLGLFPKSLRAELNLNPRSTLAAFGLEVGSYRQLRDAVTFLRERGWTIRSELPAEVHPGIDYAAFVLDPEGHCMMLYSYMEQVGWDGRPRPAALRRATAREWPEQLEPLSDTYADQTFQGPLG
jgi:catechol 2,3-dioxygenase-like lactoylglutathione lyase family enzyme